jgi:hypothetical protein
MNICLYPFQACHPTTNLLPELMQISLPLFTIILQVQPSNTSASEYIMHIRPFTTIEDTTTSPLVIWVQSMHQSHFCLGGMGNQCHIQSTQSIKADLDDEHSFLSWHCSVASSFYPEFNVRNPTLTTYREPLACTEGGSDDGSCDSQNSESLEHMQLQTMSTTILIPCQTVTILFARILGEKRHYHSALVLANEMLIIPPQCIVIITSVNTAIERHYNYAVCLTCNANEHSMKGMQWALKHEFYVVPN